MDQQSEIELRDRVKPLIEEIVYQLVCIKPENSVDFMIKWLQKKGGYTANGNISSYNIIGLTIEERHELEQLRQSIKKYRELDGNNVDSASEKSEV
jgi:hypothetical protein